MENTFSPRYKLLLMVFIGIIAISNIYNIFNQSNASITVTGQGTVSAKAGEVSMVVTRATIGDSALDAVTSGQTAMNNLIEATKKIAGANVEIKQSFYQVTPQSDGKFLMASAISVKSTNVAATDNLIKYLYANGATTVSNIAFSPKDDGASEKQSRDLALIDAKKKSTDMAKSMGKRVGKIISIAEDTTTFNSSINQGDSISLEKRISVVYAIN